MAKSFPTLDQIKSLIQTEGKIIIAAFDQDMKSLEARMGNFENMLDAHVDQNEKDFNDLHGAIQEVMDGLDKSTDQKIAKHCQEKHVFATS